MIFTKQRKWNSFATNNLHISIRWITKVLWIKCRKLHWVMMRMMITKQTRTWETSLWMLQKSNNTAQRSGIFNSLREACHYQTQQGGRIYALAEETHEREDEREKRYDISQIHTVYWILLSDRNHYVGSAKKIDAPSRTMPCMRHIPD